ncbi:MAG: hypothetical protein FWE19_00615 [Oscillospiraceae bacterium]|nr:hypothetical protein [Oscillospiraceae bacterium]
MQGNLEPVKVACTRKELSCIIANLFAEVKPICDVCDALLDSDLVLGGALAGSDDDFAYIKVTEYGFDYYGDYDVLDRVRRARCPSGTLNPPEKDGGATQQRGLPDPAEVPQG